MNKGLFETVLTYVRVPGCVPGNANYRLLVVILVKYCQPPFRQELSERVGNSPSNNTTTIIATDTTTTTALLDVAQFR